VAPRAKQVLVKEATELKRKGNNNNDHFVMINKLIND